MECGKYYLMVVFLKEHPDKGNLYKRFHSEQEYSSQLIQPGRR